MACRLQHLYILPVYSILFALWRFNSIKTIHAFKLHKSEGVLVALNYLWMGCFLPLPVAVGHVFLAGVMTATIVTCVSKAVTRIQGRDTHPRP